MKFSTIAATASFLTLVSTKPLAGKHHHNHPRAIVYETFTTEVLEIEYASTTVWVTAGESSSPTTTPVHKKLASKKTSASAPSPAATTVEAPAPSATAEAPPPPATTTETPAPLATTESSPPPPSTPEQPSSTPAAAVPPPSSTPAAAVPPPSSTPALVVPPPSSTLALVVPPSSTPAPYVPPPPPSTPPSTSPSGGSSTSSCGQVGGQCSGDITFYDILPGQYGACGFEDVNGLTDDIVALPFGMMGAQSNGNPFCGRTLSISLNGKTVSAKVVDKCGGCTDQSIDLSHHLFDQLSPESAGRISDVKWHFTS